MCCSSKKKYDTTYGPSQRCGGGGSGWIAKWAAKKAMKASETMQSNALFPESQVKYIAVSVQNAPVQKTYDGKATFYKEKTIAKRSHKDENSNITSTPSHVSGQGASRMVQVANSRKAAADEAPPSYHETIIRDASNTRRRGDLDVERYRVAGH